MLPAHLLPQLSPAASKIYLALLTFRQSNSPHITASIADLAARSSYSARTCKSALHELMTLQLLRRLPRHYHRPCTYELLPPTQVPSLAPSSETKVQPTSPSLPPKVQPSASVPPSNMHPASPSPITPPLPTPKKPTVQPLSPLLTQMLALLFDPADAAATAEIDALFHRLSPSEKSIAIALAKTYHTPSATQGAHA